MYSENYNENLNKNPTKAVIISNDASLQDRLVRNQSTNENLLSVVLSSDMVNISPRIEADAYIYDVGESDSNTNTKISHITNLKRSIFNKPLILIGDDSRLNQMLAHENIQGLVSRSMNKPFSNGQLLSAINSCVLGKKSFPDPRGFLPRRYLARAHGKSHLNKIGYYAMMAVGFGLFIFLYFTNRIIH
ncbi:MAG: hypothetical protein KTR16_01545 [Acidiferrobacterales bacterium]|nr:hypothetical protein [Acidiferrobacterales bacterium]